MAYCRDLQRNPQEAEAEASYVAGFPVPLPLPRGSRSPKSRCYDPRAKIASMSLHTLASFGAAAEDIDCGCDLDRLRTGRAAGQLQRSDPQQAAAERTLGALQKSIQ